MSELHSIFHNLVCSPVYEAKPVGFEGPSFLNMVVAADTQLTVDGVCAELKRLEDQSGRDRNSPKFSSRTLDLDLLLYGETTSNVPVELPRGEILYHAFVLKPLVDIAPALRHPVLNKSMQELWHDFAEPNQELTPYPLSIE